MTYNRERGISVRSLKLGMVTLYRWRMSFIPIECKVSLPKSLFRLKFVELSDFLHFKCDHLAYSMRIVESVHFDTGRLFLYVRKITNRCEAII
jgi:hypothetical protein